MANLWILRRFVDSSNRSEKVEKGSGSLEQDGARSVVAMKKEEQTGGRSMITDAGKRQRQAYKCKIQEETARSHFA